MSTNGSENGLKELIAVDTGRVDEDILSHEPACLALLGVISMAVDIILVGEAEGSEEEGEEEQEPHDGRLLEDGVVVVVKIKSKVVAVVNWEGGERRFVVERGWRRHGPGGLYVSRRLRNTSAVIAPAFFSPELLICSLWKFLDRKLRDCRTGVRHFHLTSLASAPT